MRRTLRQNLIGLILVMLGGSLFVVAQSDPGQKGPFKVGFTQFNVVDENRNTELGGRPIGIFLFYPVDPSTIDSSSSKAVYPTYPFNNNYPPSTSAQWEAYDVDAVYQQPSISAAKPFPLLMLSPGWTNPAVAQLFIASRAASHGFAVAVLYHFRDGVWFDPDPMDHLAIALAHRPRDVSFALDKLLERNQTAGDPMEGWFDGLKVAAAGHSLGGYAAMALAGGVESVCLNAAPLLDPPSTGLPWELPVPPESCVSIAVDPRIKAIVPIDGSNQAMLFQELARIRIPNLGIGEEWNAVLDWQAREHAAIQGKPNYRVDVAGTQHMSFSGYCAEGFVFHDIGIDPGFDADFWTAYACSMPTTNTEAQRLSAKYLVSFLKTQLVGENGFQYILTPGYALTREQKIEFFVTERRNPNSIDTNSPELFIYLQHQPGSAEARGEKNPTKPRPILPAHGKH